jgi:putative ABC transport system permease protein
LGRGAALIGDLATSLGPGTLGMGLLAVLLMAVLGSLVPALLTAKIRPIEVLRGE